MRAVVIPSRVHCKNSEVKFRKSAFSGSRPFFWSSRQMDIFAVEYSVQPCCVSDHNKKTKSANNSLPTLALWLCAVHAKFHTPWKINGRNQQITHERKEKNKKIFETKNRTKKKTCRKWWTPSRDFIFQGGKPVISQGFFFVRLRRLARKSVHVQWPAPMLRRFWDGFGRRSDLPSVILGTFRISRFCEVWFFFRYINILLGESFPLESGSLKNHD